MSIELDVERFYTRLRKLYNSFRKHKCVVLYQRLFGYELPDTILLLTEDGHVWICATKKKKCEFLQPAVDRDEDFKLH